ncbi:bifunctional [glutamate--ammonia ligase]-adenylyl-L-tyrosine phosphorylase/[glutamate--ammonia-ligase] adenylyltransferase [Sedimenticola thiotaurini]|uniref:Bifunctional glutamine synthetase adenylyltransferase/adenylyl-removing enzyme n=1 Tax=Sedimenticola thiotaurini TaxID=1543721 RepID=A0A0F7JZU4_9GAMM|nr:bifunctional [glutamate--ammonia ligase]-adenylyl-L-tyrosine phosphorylase/[glutamate--ammonia-ligase] adenylyltransferase [Sedimenticola thiotaurini]AKH20864.1 glutamine-synthetase adenylyltransferase [Sedimenticola thiotaurini]
MQSSEHPAQEAENKWRQWQSSSPELAAELRSVDGFEAALLQVWEGSDFVAQYCLKQPQKLMDLQHSGAFTTSYTDGEMERRLAERLVGVTDETALHRELRRFRNEQMVRIIWRDLTRTAPLDETLVDLSALADACVSQSLTLLYDWMTEKQGTPRNAAGEPQGLVVLGMGKLGARELNLSSDIDLIFAYPESGQTDGPRPTSNEQFFIRLCQQLVKALNSQTVDGFVFRVDARLRPFGDAGALALSFDAMETYYQSHAREWERYAMIKARVVAGDAAAGREIMAMLQPFIYRRYLDFGAIESIRDMKRLISRELMRKGMADNVKLGPGGIREIEFIGQAFQLIRGGREPELQIRPILPVLQVLGEKQQLSMEEVAELTEAYRFLRLVENRIQAWKDRQTHLLPEDDAGRLRIARCMGFADWERFLVVLDQHRARVQAHFDNVFALSEEVATDSPLQAVWDQELDDEQAIELLQQTGYSDAKSILSRLENFRQGHACRSLGTRGRHRMEQLMPVLLESVGRSSVPDVALERILRIVEAIARRTSYLALLVENPTALTQLVKLVSISPWIAQQVARHPLLLDEMLDPRRLYTPLKRERLELELDTTLAAVDKDDQEQQMERMRQFTQSNMLRVAAADLTGGIPLMVVSDYLTEIAEAVTRRVMEQAWEQMVARYGRPGSARGSGNGFAVIGYGKLGGIELGYGSDLDMVFLHGNDNPNQMTDGERPIADDLFYARMGQRMIHMYTTRTPAGILYEVDMRLRPNGNSGMLVSSLEAFEQYQRNAAWTWEHQALLRARPVAGDPAVMEQFQRIRREVLSRARDAEKLQADVREMREKMRGSLDKSNDHQFDIKQGVGGIADIEFMVQYSVLRWANKHPDLLDWTDNIRLLESLARHHLFQGEVAEQLAENYRALRAVYHRKSLSELPGVVGADELQPERGAVQALWQKLMVDPISQS